MFTSRVDSDLTTLSVASDRYELGGRASAISGMTVDIQPLIEPGCLAGCVSTATDGYLLGLRLLLATNTVASGRSTSSADGKLEAPVSDENGIPGGSPRNVPYNTCKRTQLLAVYRPAIMLYAYISKCI
jgi:hypothetical protein